METLVRKAFCCLFILAGVGVFVWMARLGLRDLGNAITTVLFVPPLIFTGIALLLNEPTADAAAAQARSQGRAV
jgi:hypothetical protein